jgi:hypothetical protein
MVYATCAGQEHLHQPAQGIIRFVSFPVLHVSVCVGRIFILQKLKGASGLAVLQTSSHLARNCTRTLACTRQSGLQSKPVSMRLKLPTLLHWFTGSLENTRTCQCIRVELVMLRCTCCSRLCADIDPHLSHAWLAKHGPMFTLFSSQITNSVDVFSGSTICQQQPS